MRCRSSTNSDEKARRLPCLSKKGEQLMKHSITIEFTTNRKLTTIELDELITDAVTQLIEPNDEATFTTSYFTINHKAD